MTFEQVMESLENLQDNKRRENLIKFGIPKENSLGVSTTDIKKIAKQVGKNTELAIKLWDTEIHDAKLLAVLLIVPTDVDDKLVKKLMDETYSWDLCHLMCKNLLINVPNYKTYIDYWVADERLYYKRAGFSLIATQVINEKKLSDEDAQKYFEYIELYAAEDRVHAYKAIAWALKEIGKMNETFHEQALICAHDLCESGDKNKMRIGKDALKELENVIKVEGRERLINKKAKMAVE